MLLIIAHNILDYYLHIPLPNNTLIIEVGKLERTGNSNTEIHQPDKTDASVFCCTCQKKNSVLQQYYS